MTPRLTDPAAIRNDVRRSVDTLFEGADGEVEPALNELWNLLEDYPELRERFARLRIIADAIDFVKDRTNPRTKLGRRISQAKPA